MSEQRAAETTLDLTKLAIGTRLRTRCGKPARLLANDIRGIAPCVIAVDVSADNEQLHNVDADGAISEGSKHPHDIVGVERPKRRVRVQVIKHNLGDVYYFAADPALATGYLPNGSETIIADAIVEIEELSPAGPVGDAGSEP